MEAKPVTAGLVVIGNEILSGRTRDANTQFIGAELNDLGIRLAEVRVVADVCGAIVGAVEALRKEYDYVFVTGGLGPTHDDITARSIAKAFAVELVCDPEAHARLERHYGSERFNAARQRMAYIPEGAALIDNPVSAAPGFRIENVFVMAGIPRIMQAMFASVRHRLSGGAPLLSRTIGTDLGEGTLAAELGRVQEAFPDIQIGSYPSMGSGRSGVRIVLRSVSEDRLGAAVEAVRAMAARLGGQAEELDITG
ncbi:MAG: competence/damage-inducible protein A [Alphaproteobacteria bacterium]|nr:MAG: competence/damage-inducible protein A [Alphaproteobacteria bacterium]